MVASNPAPTLSLRLFRPFNSALAARGVDLRSLIDGLPIGLELFRDPDGRIAHAVAMELLGRAVKASGDDALGIHAAELVRPGDFDALELVARASVTQRSALEAVSRFIRLMHDATTLGRVVEGEYEAWALTISSPSPRAAVEFALATFVLVSRSVTGKPDCPHEVHFMSEPPADASEHERVFGCTVRWNAPRNALVLETHQLDRAFARTSPGLALALEQHTARLLAELPNAGSYAARVREQIVAALRNGQTSSDEVCRRLHVSDRTLRRRLRDEGVTYSDVLADVRQELSQRYLDDPTLSIAEIAFLLGFSDARSFQRSFRRTSGMAPSAYRRRRE